MLTSSTRTCGHDDVAATLACEIISGARPAGSRMPTVEEMHHRFGVSRVLTREVTKTLTAKGLIVAKSKVGTLVLPAERWNWIDPDFLAWRVRIGMDVEFFRQLHQIRRAVEPAAAALATERCSSGLLQELSEALDGMSRAGGDPRAFAEADLRFHLALIEASGNPLFRSFASVVRTALSASLSLTAPLDSAAIVAVVDRHAAIAHAVQAGDAERAARAMLDVIGDAKIDF